MSKIPWYVARSSGIVAWALILATIVWGLLLATKVLGRKPGPAWLLSLHRYLGALTIAFVGVHVGAILLDSYTDFGVTDVLVPFTGSWHPLAVAWGIVGMYLLMAIEITRCCATACRNDARQTGSATSCSLPRRSTCSMGPMQRYADAWCSRRRDVRGVALYVWRRRGGRPPWRYRPDPPTLGPPRLTCAMGQRRGLGLAHDGPPTQHADADEHQVVDGEGESPVTPSTTIRRVIPTATVTNHERAHAAANRTRWQPRPPTEPDDERHDLAGTRRPRHPRGDRCRLDHHEHREHLDVRAAAIHGRRVAVSSPIATVSPSRRRSHRAASVRRDDCHR
jgi:hypothetical protein